MPDIEIRREGRAGRITLHRPQALNALTRRMCREIDDALTAWRDEDGVHIVVIDAEGTRAFCAGGDIARIHDAARAGDFDAGRAFWADEYRMNARLKTYPKPVVALMQGFVMGGGVGLGCHASHRVVGDSTRMAMPECGIGLIPDVGGTLLLSAAPGRLGEYLGLTGARMSAGDAITAGFADYYLPETDWPTLLRTLCDAGGTAALPAREPPAPALPQAAIDRAFSAESVSAIAARLDSEGGDFASGARKALGEGSPLSMACTLAAIRAQRGDDDIHAALRREFRFTWRSMDKGDFLEGVRARIIDKDRAPRWRHAGPEDVTDAEVAAMLAPLGEDELTFERVTP